MDFMEQSRVCISKKTTYIGLGIILIAGMLLFNFWTLQSNQATNSKAAEPAGLPANKINLRSPMCYAEVHSMCLYPVQLDNKLTFEMRGNDATLFETVKDLAKDDSKIGIATYYQTPDLIQRNIVVGSLTGNEIKKMDNFKYELGNLKDNPNLKTLMNKYPVSFLLYYIKNDAPSNMIQGQPCETIENKYAFKCISYKQNLVDKIIVY